MDFVHLLYLLKVIYHFSYECAGSEAVCKDDYLIHKSADAYCLAALHIFITELCYHVGIPDLKVLKESTFAKVCRRVKVCSDGTGAESSHLDTRALELTVECL